MTLPSLGTKNESSKCGFIINIKDTFNVKRWKDIETEMYESAKLELVFLEILNDIKKNEIFGCIYRHPTMDTKIFNEKYFNEVVTKITDEKKICYLAGDFNIDLMKSEVMTDTKDFLTFLLLTSLSPIQNSPQEQTSRSQTLIDKILYI